MPLDREQAGRLKAIVGRPVPKDYATALRNLPKSFASLQNKGLAADELPLFLDGEVIVQQNELAREEDIWTEEGPWPSDHIMIGAETSGDKFSLCVTDKQVHRLLHATAEMVPLCNLTAYIRALEPFAQGKMSLGDALTKLEKKPKPRKKIAPKKSGGGSDDRIARLQRKVDKAKTDWDRSYALWDLAEDYERAGRVTEALACHDRVIALGAVAAIRYKQKIGVLNPARYDWKPDCPRYRAAFRELFGSSQGYYEALIATYDGYIAALEASGDRPADLAEARRQREDAVAESKDESERW